MNINISNENVIFAAAGAAAVVAVGGLFKLGAYGAKRFQARKGKKAEKTDQPRTKETDPKKDEYAADTLRVKREELFGQLYANASTELSTETVENHRDGDYFSRKAFTFEGKTARGVDSSDRKVVVIKVGESQLVIFQRYTDSWERIAYNNHDGVEIDGCDLISAGSLQITDLKALIKYVTK